MRKSSALLNFTSIVAFFLLTTSCSLKSKVTDELRQLDSLHIVLQTKLNQLQGADTILLNKALSRFSSYASFIENHIQDTLQKEEAGVLQEFYLSGNNLKSFIYNRSALMARMNLVSSQITKLKTDTESNAMRRDEFLMHYTTEINACKELILLSEKQIDGFNSAIGIFKSNLQPLEDLIKKRNNGLLPTEVKTSTSL